jgi:Ca2+-dependent lipid-binding protein
VLSTHFLTRFNFGFGWVFIILAFCATYYKTSIQRVRRNARDDIQRELVKTRLLNEHESAEWMNNFLDVNMSIFTYLHFSLNNSAALLAHL